MGKASRLLERNISETSQNDGTTKNRNRAGVVAAAYAEATNAVTFTPSDDVNEVSITFSAAIGEPIQDDSTALIIFDGLNEATEVAMFADAGSISTDVEYIRVPMKDIYHELFTSYLGRIAILPSKDVTVTVLAQ